MTGLRWRRCGREWKRRISTAYNIYGARKPPNSSIALDLGERGLSHFKPRNRDEEQPTYFHWLFAGQVDLDYGHEK